MKYKYILASALSLAVVGASIISPFSFSAFDDSIATQIYNEAKDLANFITVAVGEQFGQYACVVLSQYGDESIYHFKITNSINQGEYIEYYFSDCWYESQGTFDNIGSGIFTLWANYISFKGWSWYIDRPNEGRQVIYCDLPFDVGRNGNYSESSIFSGIANAHKTSISGHTSTFPFASNIQTVIEKYSPPAPTEPPYTNPAPAFPNLPDNWVNGDGNTYNIDLPDFDFNIDLPSYTMPEAVSIPADIVQKSSALYQIPLNIIDRYGLWWLVGLALICTVITLILNR